MKNYKTVSAFILGYLVAVVYLSVNYKGARHLYKYRDTTPSTESREVIEVLRWN